MSVRTFSHIGTAQQAPIRPVAPSKTFRPLPLVRRSRTGTFESLLDDIYDGVIDTHDSGHVDGYAKVCAVTKAARDMQITANALITCTNPKDRDGICHQLVNEERLQWTQS